ncbi:unnamed protein product [Blepharisma stoltei]|uniref:Uncharacterized protein n=1 Tax=Blepharisma stoltei TaxID=1481888 RepID=A0AAU9IXH4_9CILI|nr:unnamed protein product [Blepharisma stoltei]
MFLQNLQKFCKFCIFLLGFAIFFYWPCSFFFAEPCSIFAVPKSSPDFLYENTNFLNMFTLKWEERINLILLHILILTPPLNWNKNFFLLEKNIT